LLKMAHRAPDLKGRNVWRTILRVSALKFAAFDFDTKHAQATIAERGRHGEGQLGEAVARRGLRLHLLARAAHRLHGVGAAPPGFAQAQDIGDVAPRRPSARG
jgi:hypothetical protein